MAQNVKDAEARNSQLNRFTSVARSFCVTTVYREDDDKLVILFPSGNVCEVSADFIAEITKALGAETAWKMFNYSLHEVDRMHRIAVDWPPEELEELVGLTSTK